MEISYGLGGIYLFLVTMSPCTSGTHVCPGLLEETVWLNYVPIESTYSSTEDTKSSRYL